MHDLKTVRDDPRAFDLALQRRGLPPHADLILDLDKKHRALIQRLQELQARRNEVSKQIGQLKAKGGNADAAIAETARIKTDLPKVEQEEREAQAAVQVPLDSLPNIPAADVPVGKSADDNKEIRKHGTPPTFDFPVKDHVALGEKLGMDISTAAKISGARFTLLKGQLARLERALAQFMLDMHTKEFGYTECSVPLMVRDNAAYGTGNLPKFGEDLFRATLSLPAMQENIRGTIASTVAEFANSQGFFERIKNWLDQSTDKLQGELVFHTIELENKVRDLRNQLVHSFDDASLTASLQVARLLEKNLTRSSMELTKDERLLEKYWLIPTAEMPLTNIVADSILEESQLPQRFTAFTPCFRSEAGAAGKDTHGMLRQHQFYKVELVSVTHPDQSEAEHQRMTNCAEEVLKRLELPYRTVVLCTGDMGFAAQKTYDIEVWLPGQNAYREISSCSNCGEFQARRMKARFKSRDGKGNRFVHTLNGSGLAVGRTLIAVLENFQRRDGSVAVPKALVPYMGGVEVLQ